MDMTTLRLPAVKAATGLPKSTIYRLISESSFPRPLKLSAKAVGWRASDIRAWLDSRPTA